MLWFHLIWLAGVAITLTLWTVGWLLTDDIGFLAFGLPFTILVVVSWAWHARKAHSLAKTPEDARAYVHRSATQREAASRLTLRMNGVVFLVFSPVLGWVAGSAGYREYGSFGAVAGAVCGLGAFAIGIIMLGSGRQNDRRYNHRDTEAQSESE